MKRALVVCLLVAGCSSSSPRSTPEPGPTATASGSAAAPTRASYTGPADRGPCESAHDCKLRDVCGCSCEGVRLTAPDAVACDESCPGDGCKGYSVICALTSQTCGAIPKAP